MADSPSVLLYFNGVEAGANMEWDMSTEEVLGGPGRATLTVQDRTNSWVPQPHWDVQCVLASGPFAGQVIFHGEIISQPLIVETGMEWRKWKFTCVDYSYEFGWRLVGALDGETWLDTSGLGVYVNIDPFASTLKTDKLTIQQWFDHYIRIGSIAVVDTDNVWEALLNTGSPYQIKVGGVIYEAQAPDFTTGASEPTFNSTIGDLTADGDGFWKAVGVPGDVVASSTAIGTDTHVGAYLADFLTLTPTYSKLDQALQQLAAYVAGNLQFWLDPDLEFHWRIIPNWQDLIGASIVHDDSLGLLSPSAPGSLAADLGFAPYNLSDVLDPALDPDVLPDSGNPPSVGFHSLKMDLDGAEMPQQVYVRGGTGYVYNAPPIATPTETKTVVKVPVQGADGTYQLFITVNNTKLWHVDGTGYVSVTYELADIGGPWPVKFVHVAWNEARNKGGYYWKFLSGPHQGLLADDHTNGLNAYGHIRVELIGTSPGPTPEPQIGIGGSGWVGEVTQDLNKRQAYLDASISVTRGLRDSLGGQTLYRGQFPTLRGAAEITGYDGWRVGKLVKLTDVRLPANLNEKYYVIQRVQTQLHKETLLRKYTIDFGDGPTSRYSFQASKGSDVSFPHPANAIFIDAFDLSPGPDESQVVTGQLVNGAGEPWAIPGKVVEWSVECYNAAGVLQPGVGELDPTVSITDRSGKARTTLTSGAGHGLVYYVFAATRAL